MPPRAQPTSRFFEILPHRGAGPLPSGPKLRILQRFLHETGFLALEGQGSAPGASPPSKLPAAVLGESEKETIKALKDYQKFQALAVTGELDDDTVHWMAFPRCGHANRQSAGSALEKPAAAAVTAAATGEITYSIAPPGSQHLTEDEVSAAFEEAFAIWGEIINRTFTEMPDGGSIRIRFIGRNSPDYSSAGGLGSFEGRGRNLAWAEVGGTRASFDDEEIWRLDQPPLPGVGSGVDLISVATHEIGHLLGLFHSNDRRALMFDTHFGPHRFLTDDDRARIEQLLGIS